MMTAVDVRRPKSHHIVTAKIFAKVSKSHHPRENQSQPLYKYPPLTPGWGVGGYRGYFLVESCLIRSALAVPSDKLGS